MSLIDVSEWSMQEVVNDPPAGRAHDPTFRCEHGRPRGGNPCEQCVCPVGHGWRHLIRAITNTGTLKCDRCGGVYEGAPYPFKSGRARK